MGTVSLLSALCVNKVVIVQDLSASQVGQVDGCKDAEDGSVILPHRS